MKKSLCAVLFALTIAQTAWAQDGLLNWGQFGYSGVVQQVVPGGVYLRTSDGLQVLLPQGLQFNVAGRQMEIGSLVPGSPVQVMMPPGQGQLVGVYNNIATIQGPYGPMQVPMQYLPEHTSKNCKVAVLKPNGKTVHVPLNAAMNMQRSQGATILGAPVGQAWPMQQPCQGTVIGINQGNYQILVNQSLYQVPCQWQPNLMPGAPFQWFGQGNIQGNEDNHGNSHGHGHENKGNGHSHGHGHDD